MNSLLLVAALFAAGGCQAYIIKVKNHTDQDIKVTLERVTKKSMRATIKPGDVHKFDTKESLVNYTWKGIRVETKDGKRKGQAGDYCHTYFWSNEDAEPAPRGGDCDMNNVGIMWSTYFDVYLPSQGSYSKKRRDSKRNPVKDTGKNLVVARRFDGTKY
jgi:hypothetical protein